jgi:hypothetical protein
LPALFVIQARLIAAQNYRTHMQLGIAGIVVAVLVVIFGFATAIVVLVTAAVLLRKRAQPHKRLMTLAMISILGPPIARLIAVTNTGDNFVPIQIAVAAVCLAWCLVSDRRKYRTCILSTRSAAPSCSSACPVRFLSAQTPQWERVGQWLAGS